MIFGLDAAILSPPASWKKALIVLMPCLPSSCFLCFTTCRLPATLSVFACQTIISQTCYGLHLLHLFQEARTKTLLYALLYGPESLQRAGVLPIRRPHRAHALPAFFLFLVLYHLPPAGNALCLRLLFRYETLGGNLKFVF